MTWTYEPFQLITVNRMYHLFHHSYHEMTTNVPSNDLGLPFHKWPGSAGSYSTYNFTLKGGHDSLWGQANMFCSFSWLGAHHTRRGPVSSSYPMHVVPHPCSKKTPPIGTHFRRLMHVIA